MGIEGLVHSILEQLVIIGKAIHFPLLFGTFVLGVAGRVLVYRMVKKYHWFSREFENRVAEFLAHESPQKTSKASFYVLAKKFLEGTFYELSFDREQSRKAKPDRVLLSDDRWFLTKWGMSWFVVNTLKQVRFLQYNASQPPKLLNITKTLLGKNPVFNRLFGFIPVGGLNDFLNILPGLFVIGGIFGTFLGVMKGLPELSAMDLNDPALTKTVMDKFLIDVALSMGASVVGIFLSVCMTLVNTTYSPERLYVDMIDRLENTLDLLWNYANNNEVPSDLKPFDENRNPQEALAEAAVSQEYQKYATRYAVEEKPMPKSA